MCGARSVAYRATHHRFLQVRAAVPQSQSRLLMLFQFRLSSLHQVKTRAGDIASSVVLTSSSCEWCSCWLLSLHVPMLISWLPHNLGMSVCVNIRSTCAHDTELRLCKCKCNVCCSTLIHMPQLH